MLINIITNGIEIVAALVGQPDSTALEQKIVNANIIKTKLIQDTTKQEFTANNVEYHATKKLENNKGRINLFYNLPGNTNTYTFVEFYKNDGFFARTMAFHAFNKHKTNIQAEMKNSNLFSDRIALGLSQKFNKNNIYGNIKILPAWFDLNGILPKSASIGGLIGTSFNIGKKDLRMDIFTFGEMNVIKEGGPQWAYGEAEAVIKIPTKIGKFDIGIGYNFNPIGKAMPDTQFRAKIGYHPRK